jgi:hypothetical protein
MFANVSGLNAAPCRNLILTTTVDWGCVLALVIGSQITDYEILN